MPIVIDMWPSQTVEELKLAISKVGGVPFEEQRLYFRSCRLNDDQEIGACGLIRQPEVQLVPALHHRAIRGVSPIQARRGFNMVPGNQPWRPSKAAIISKQDLSEKFWGHSGHDGLSAKTAALPPLPSLPSPRPGPFAHTL